MSSRHTITDQDAVEQVLSLFESSPDDWVTVRRNGRLLLVLPKGRSAALRALDLYQPQRWMARNSMALLRMVTATGIHRLLLPKLHHHGGLTALRPESGEVVCHSTGILLGSPEHKVRRAIACYQTKDGLEVAKIAFGAEGCDVIRGEADALASLPENTSGAPPLLGLHCGPGISLLRLPYIDGSVLKPGESKEAVMLLDAWRSGRPPQGASTFPEWPAITKALSRHVGGAELIRSLSERQLEPVVRHGDFARWNLLRQKGGDLMVLDWEWGLACGMPGLDLVHFFAQDARLVDRLAPHEVLRATASALMKPQCARYLEATGWRGDPKLAMLASIAFTVGTSQQANEEVLAALIRNLSPGVA